MNQKKHLKFKGANASQFTNGLHAQFHHRLNELISRVEISKLNVSADMMTEWKAAIDVETEINRQSSVSELTRKLHDKDRERDNVLTNIFGVVRSQCYSPLEPIREAALKLSAVFKPYVGIQEELLEKETASIRGLEKDASRLASEIGLLGLSPVLNELNRLNEEYGRLFLKRHDDAQLIKLPSAREARRRTDDAFEAILQCILASYQISTVDADRKMISDLVDGLNEMSSKFRASHKESLSQKKSAADKKKPGGGDKKPGDDKKPSDPKKPDDGKKPDDPKKPDDGKTPKPGREEDPGEDQV